jgi:hypothetical protein
MKNIVITLIIFVLLGCSHDDSLLSDEISNIVTKKSNGHSIPKVILSGSGQQKAMENAYLDWLEHVRLSSLNKGIMQEPLDIPDNLFGEIRIIAGMRENSRTGQEFNTFRYVGEFNPQIRQTLLEIVAPYNGWCYWDMEDALVCDIPMNVSK